MNMQNALKQAQALQGKMGELQKRLEGELVEGKAAGGLVRITTTCKGDVKKVWIDESLLDKEEKEVLEDLIVAAFNNAKQEADNKSNDEMKKIASSMGIPLNMLNLSF